MPHLVIVIVQTLPMSPELLKTILIDVVDTVISSQSAVRSKNFARLIAPHFVHPSIFQAQRIKTHTLAAHLVAFLPSRMHSISPFPCACVLHTM